MTFERFASRIRLILRETQALGIVDMDIKAKMERIKRHIFNLEREAE